MRELRAATPFELPSWTYLLETDAAIYELSADGLKPSNREGNRDNLLPSQFRGLAILEVRLRSPCCAILLELGHMIVYDLNWNPYTEETYASVDFQSADVAIEWIDEYNAMSIVR